MSHGHWMVERVIFGQNMTFNMDTLVAMWAAMAFLLLISFHDGTVTAAKKKHRFLGGADTMVYYSYLLQGDQSCVIKVIH